LVEGKEYEGLGLRKEQVVEHIRDLRSLGYQILNSLTTGNQRTSLSLVSELAPKLPMMIITDSLTSGFLSTPESNIGIDTASFEALDLLLNLCSNKELFIKVFKETLTHKTLEGLLSSCSDFEFGDPSK
jgi:hypothetical protein